MKRRFAIYPHLPVGQAGGGNPYINDFVATIQTLPSCKVVNRPHKNPLLSLLHPKSWADVYVFNWYESIPDYKYGYLQALIALCLVGWVRICGKRVVWVLHNKRPHSGGRMWVKRLMAAFMARQAHLILTHAEEGVELVAIHHPRAVHKVKMFHHPTKNRLDEVDRTAIAKEYDLLVWGAITPYKGVLELAHYLQANESHGLRVCVAGHCADESLKQVLRRFELPGLKWELRRLSFEELAVKIGQSNYVLTPYQPETVLSSGILMDSLSFGAKVIGPRTGAFRDCSTDERLKVYTFDTLDELASLVEAHRGEEANLAAYADFLKENSWTHFASRLLQALHLSTTD